MKFYEEKSLRDFDFWAGAVDNARQFTCDELDEAENILADAYGDEISDTQINDIFWFDFEWLCEMLGLELDENGDIIREE